MEKSKFTTWLYRIVHNVAISEIRKNKIIASEEISSEHPIAARNGSDPMKALTEKQIKDKINAALDSLPENFKETLILYYMEELSYNEIAEILDIPIGTVKTYLFRGKIMLRQILNNINKLK